MHKLQIFLFGKFRIHVDGQDLFELKARKAQELLSYILLNNRRSHHREALANILWEDIDATQSKRYFRRVLWQLQSAFAGLTDTSNRQALLVDEEWIEFNPTLAVEVDAVFVEECYKSVRDVPGQQLHDDAVRQIKQAIQHYQGDLLEGWYHEWCLFERERFQQIYLSLLDKMMLYSEINGVYESGISYGTQILRHDKVREHTHRRLMRLFFLSGNRTEALHQYEQCTTILRDELGVKPGHATEMLCQQIENDQLPGQFYEQDGDVPSTPDSRHVLIQKMYGELQQIRDVLLNIQHQVQDQADVVESVLKE